MDKKEETAPTTEGTVSWLDSLCVALNIFRQIPFHDLTCRPSPVEEKKNSVRNHCMQGKGLMENFIEVE